jgi:hypothetical protein
MGKRGDGLGCRWVKGGQYCAVYVQTIQYSIAVSILQCGTVPHNTVQQCAIQYSTVLYVTTQYGLMHITHPDQISATNVSVLRKLSTPFRYPCPRP